MCPRCKDKSGASRGAGSIFAEAKQHSKGAKGLEEPLPRLGQKVGFLSV